MRKWIYWTAAGWLVMLLAADSARGAGLTGTWTAGNMTIIFQGDGQYLWKHPGGQLAGAYQAQGDRLVLRFQGKETAYRYRLEEPELQLTDGSGQTIRLTRQAAAPAPPAPAPSRPAQSPLPGVWSSGGLSITFRTDGSYTWKHPGGALEGRYREETKRLVMEYRGKETVYTLQIEQNRLSMTDASGQTLRLTRQVPAAPAPAPVPAPLPVPAGQPSAPPPAGGSKLAQGPFSGSRLAGDGSCRLPLAAGCTIQEKTFPGGPFYDAMANMVIQRPPRTVQQFIVQGKVAGTLARLNGELFPVRDGNLQQAMVALTRAYINREILEDGDYKVVKGPVQDTWNGLPRSRMLVRDDSDSAKSVLYLMETFQEGSAPVIVLVAGVHTENSGDSWLGLKARPAGDLIQAALAEFYLDESPPEALQTKMQAMLAGMQLVPLAANPALERSLHGSWEAVENPAQKMFVGSSYLFSPDHRFEHTVDVSNPTQAGYSRRVGVYRMLGRLLLLEYQQGEPESYPVVIEGRTLKLGGKYFVR